MRTVLNISKFALAFFFCLSILTIHSTVAETEALPDNTIELSLNEALIMSLENNKSLQAQRLLPQISKMQEEQAKSNFDLKLSNSLSSSTNKGSSGSTSKGVKDSLGISKPLHSGGDISLELSSDESGSASDELKYSSRIGISLTQSLLKGAGTDVNLADIKKAGLNTESSFYELQAYTETLVEQVISTYWDYALAGRKLKIYEDSLELARQLQHETEVMVEVGKLAEIELVSAQAEVALREQSLINIKSQLETLKLKLLRLINPSGMQDLWKTDIIIKDDFTVTKVDLADLESHIKTAMQNRPDLNQARLKQESGDLEIIKTKNGLLPYLDFFVTLGYTGYADTLGHSLGDIFNEGSDLRFGLNYSVTVGRRSDKSSYDIALISKRQSDIAMENLELLIQEEVRGAWIEIERTRSQIDAVGATRKLQEEKLRAESEKYRIEKSTSLNVAQAQRDLLQSQVDEAQAIADNFKSLVSLYLLESTLLEKYGITVLKDTE